MNEPLPQADEDRLLQALFVPPPPNGSRRSTLQDDAAIMKWRQGGHYVPDESEDPTSLGGDINRILDALERNPPEELDPQIHQFVSDPAFVAMDSKTGAFAESSGIFLEGCNEWERDHTISSLTFLAIQQIWERKQRPDNIVLSHICGICENRNVYCCPKIVIRSFCTQLLKAFPGQLDLAFLCDPKIYFGRGRLDELLNGAEWEYKDVNFLFGTLLAQISSLILREGRPRLIINIIVDGFMVRPYGHVIVGWLRIVVGLVNAQIRDPGSYPTPNYLGILIKYIVTSPDKTRPEPTISSGSFVDSETLVYAGYPCVLPGTEPIKCPIQDPRESRPRYVIQRSSNDTLPRELTPIPDAFVFPAPLDQGPVSSPEAVQTPPASAVEMAGDVFGELANAAGMETEPDNFNPEAAVAPYPRLPLHSPPSTPLS